MSCVPWLSPSGGALPGRRSNQRNRLPKSRCRKTKTCILSYIKKESHLFTVGSMLIIKYSHAVTAVFTKHKEINCRILADHAVWQWLTDSYFLWETLHRCTCTLPYFGKERCRCGFNIPLPLLYVLAYGTALECQGDIYSFLQPFVFFRSLYLG